MLGTLQTTLSEDLVFEKHLTFLNFRKLTPNVCLYFVCRQSERR